ncbi:MAG: Gfo/Idh/MocA family oxidoreductase [Gemmatales bacterium]|nr:Gfo/Idh/MocA family oxidoreductase [Gemmatales bacterium]MDW8222679.1 Gfo/Idh/MocA family oxidoreductase [Gemmatales bacterium]
MARLTRREFLGSSLIAGAFMISGTKSSGLILGANDRLRVGIAGLNGRGGAHVSAFLASPGVEITYLIDPDTRVFARQVGRIEKQQGRPPLCVQDVRKALDDKNLDILSIATPNHWHALMSIWACQAGKDVYVEKPLSHNVKEGRILVDTARKYQRIVQHGTQNRSSSAWARLRALVESGKLGRLLVSRGLCYKLRPSIGFKEPSPAPAQVDFNLWLGPAPEQPHHANLVHYNWHWFWDFGNGDIGNQGVHQMDLARWMIPGATLPVAVFSLGGRFGYKDQGQTPNTQIALFDYGPKQPLLIFEVRGLPTSPLHGQSVGNILHFEGGIIAGNKFYPAGSNQEAPLPAVDVPPRAPGDIFANFLACVRSRKVQDLHADVLEGHYSSALCHLANVSYRLGQDVSPEQFRNQLRNDHALQETLARMEEHLKQNNIVLSDIRYRVGRRLKIDPDTETIVGDAEANQLLFRQYRPPFVVPDRVR